MIRHLKELLKSPDRDPAYLCLTSGRAMEPHELTTLLKAKALELGFDLVGACDAAPAEGFERLVKWLREGRHASMTYMADRMEAYRAPTSVLPEARSGLLLGVSYFSGAGEANAPPPNVARYARSGLDYHDWVRSRLKQLAKYHRELTPNARVRGVVDTAPLLEREYAALAGLGAVGRNTLLIHDTFGGWLFLAALLTSERLISDAPLERGDPCGSCTACLKACPTNALSAEHGLDARRCLSYWTIEHRGPIDDAIAERMVYVFGCDACQDVCPWNREPLATKHEAFQANAAFTAIDPTALLALDEETFRDRYKKSPMARAGRSGLLRNAAIVLGNRWASRPDDARAGGDLEALARALDDGDPVIRDASAWALGRIGGSACVELLRKRLDAEGDGMVRSRIERVLASLAPEA